MSIDRSIGLKVREKVFLRVREKVTIPLSGDERAAIWRIAAARGVDEAVLLHEWVLEKLHH